MDIVSSEDYRNAVFDAFSFLVSRYSYSIIPPSEATFSVCFESTAVTISVLYDARQSYELAVHFDYEMPNGACEVFCLRDIMFAKGFQDYYTPQAQGAVALAKVLGKTADLVQLHAENLVLGDAFSYCSLYKNREEMQNRYHIENVTRQARSKAEIAWQNKDYHDVVSVLESIHSHLSEAELKKLEYCKKMSEVPQ